MTRQLAVIVVNYGSHELLERNLVPLDLVAHGVAVVVVDNFTSAQEQIAVSDLGREHGWRTVLNDGNVGFGSAVNQGTGVGAELGAQNYLFLNPDLEISISDIQILLGTIAPTSMVALSPLIVNSMGRPWFAGGQLDLRDGAVKTSAAADMSAPTAWLSGACLLVGRELWELSGGFDPDYFLYWEDVDFSFRCRRAGGSLQVVRDVEVVHHVGGTQGAGKSPTYLYYNCRNRLVFAANWLPRATQRRWVRGSAAVGYQVWRRGGRASMLNPRAFVAVVGGTAAGIWHVVGRRRRRRDQVHGGRRPVGSRP